MSRPHPFLELTLAKLRDFVREPEVLFWVFVFPLILAVVLGLAFRSKGPEVLPVGVVDAAGGAELVRVLDADARLTAALVSESDARRALRKGAQALVVLPPAGGDTAVTYWYDPTRPDSALARLTVDDVLQRAAGRSDPRATAVREVTERGSRYIDFLVPGLLGMNLMGTGMWGVGFAIVNARAKKLLKQLVATPMRKSDYLASQMVARLIFLLPEVGIIVAFSHWVLGVPMRGSLLALVVVNVVGALAFSGLGLLVAARPRTIEGVSGLMNLAMMPMWVLSGIFFSTERFPAMMQPVIQALPLTAVNDALRAVMIDGATLGAVAGELAIAAAWGVLTFAVALVGFRWQ